MGISSFSGQKFNYSVDSTISNNLNSINNKLSNLGKESLDKLKEKQSETKTEVVELDDVGLKEKFSSLVDKLKEEMSKKNSAKVQEAYQKVKNNEDLTGEDFKALYEANMIDTKSEVVGIPGTRSMYPNPFYHKDAELASGNYSGKAFIGTYAIHLDANKPNAVSSDMQSSMANVVSLGGDAVTSMLNSSDGLESAFKKQNESNGTEKVKDISSLLSFDAIEEAIKARVEEKLNIRK